RIEIGNKNYGQAFAEGLPKNVYVKQIAVGLRHLLVLCTNGIVYGVGSNENGQLGLERENKALTTFYPLSLPKVNKIYASSLSSFFLCEGKLYACGMSSDGDLGLGQIENQFTPECILKDKKITIKNVVSSNCTTFIVTEEGAVFSCGWNGDGRL